MAERNGNQATTNLVEYSVSELAFALKRTVEEAYWLVKLRGEISGFKGQHSSGHCYFTLKDERAAIEAVIWRSTFRRLKVKPEQGLEVVVKGRITTYPDKSKYQIVIDDLEPAGIGALMALLEQRKRQLAAEGLFDAHRKLPLPYLPRIVGVITSPTGAVISDILHRLADRFPCHVLVWPVRVQGETCAIEVAAAVHGFNGLIVGAAVPRPDLIIVARGGGSLEDLWGFNEEIVARAVAANTIPLISAVGHETDWTIIDLVADFRAPTPTAAAERAVPVRADLHIQVTSFGLRVASSLRRLVEAQRNFLLALPAACRGEARSWRCPASTSMVRAPGSAAHFAPMPMPIASPWHAPQRGSGRILYATRRAEAAISSPASTAQGGARFPLWWRDHASASMRAPNSSTRSAITTCSPAALPWCATLKAACSGTPPR